MGVDLAARVDQLQTTLSKMELALGAIADAIVWTGCDNRVQWCNAAFDRLVDHDHTSILNQPLPQVLPLQVQGQPLVRCDYPSYQVLAGDYQTAQYEFCQGEQTRCLEISGSLIYFDDDHCSAVMVIRDITAAKRRGEERQRHLFALQEAEHRYRSMFEHAPLGIYQTRLDGVCITVNPALAQRLGYESPTQFLADSVGMGCDRYCHPADYQTFQQKLQQEEVISGFEAALWRQDGSPLWVSTSARLVTDSAGQAAYYEAFVEDISDRKQAESRLRQSEETFRRMVERANDVIYLLNPAGEFAYVSPNVVKVAGFVPEEMVGQPFAPFVHPDDLPVCVQGFEAVIAQEQDQLEIEFRARHRAGHWVWHSANLASSVDEAGNPAVLGITRDIQERKQREEALRLIVEGTASQTGHAFFESCVSYIADLLSVQSVMITEYVDNRRDRVRTLALWLGGLQQNFEFDLAGTPCEPVLQGQMVYYEKELTTLFPWDDMLVEQGLESYLGIPLVGSAGEVIGHIAILDTQPMAANPNRELFLRIFAARAGAELERQHAEAALRQREAKYRAIFENSQVGIGRTRLSDGLILEANQRFADIVGYGSPTELIDRVSTAEFYVQPGDRNRILTVLSQKGGVHHDFELQLRRRDGREIWGLLSLRLNEEEDCLEFVIADICDRKRAEASLQRTNSLLQAQQQAAIDGILVVDEHRHISWYNHRFRELWAIAQPDLETEDDMTIVATVLNQLQDPDAFLSKIQQLYESPAARSQDEILLKDGRVFDRYSAPVVSDDGDYFGRIWFFRDITERRQLEESLRRSEAFLNIVVENIPITVFAKNIQDDYRYELINPNCDRILGFSHYEGLGKNDYDLLPAPLAEHYRRQDEEIIAQGQTVENSEAITQPYTGETIYIRSLKVPLFDDGGQPTYLLGIGEDITERKRQEEALRLIVEGTAAQTGQAFFRTCVRYLAQVLNVRYAFLSEFNGGGTATTLAYWEDDAIAENFTYAIPGTPCAGLTPDQLLIYPRNVKALFPHSPRLQQMEAEGYMGAPLMHSSGRMLGHLAVLSATPLTENPGQELILKIFAARAGAELERKQAEDTFAKAFRSSPSPISITTLAEGRFVEVNSSYLRLTGYRRDDLIGQRVTDLNLGIDTPTYDQGIEDLIQAGVLHNREVELRIRSGETRTILLSVELIELQGQRCALSIANDITERKRLENEFISLVSHELRTPMTALIGSLDLVATGQLGDLTPRGQQIVQVAISNTERLIRLVNDILDLERMKSGQLTLHKTHCNLAALLDQAIAAMQAMSDQAQIALVVESLPLEVWVDGDRMQQLLTNLLSNAIKFSPPSGTVWLRAQVQKSGWVDGYEGVRVETLDNDPTASTHPPIHP
ncbi:hypothetical protein C7293_27870, partial [filamentous cyanobacterium CCT1]